jgi:hypothetical protein
MPTEVILSHEQRRIGRPSEFSQDVADYILVCISNGMSVRQILKHADTAEGQKELKMFGLKNLPTQSTIYYWLIKYPHFSEQYAQAREDQADTLADEIIAIADEMPMETTDKEGNTRFDPAYIQWQRNRIDARKWTAMKLKPKKYGEAHKNPEEVSEANIVDVMAKEVVNALVKNIEMKRQVLVSNA